MSLSLHWDDNFFIELTATPTLEKRPDQASQIFAAHVAEIPGRVETYTARLAPQPYGQQLIARLPEMLRKLAAYIAAVQTRITW